MISEKLVGFEKHVYTDMLMIKEKKFLIRCFKIFLVLLVRIEVPLGPFGYNLCIEFVHVAYVCKPAGAYLFQTAATGHSHRSMFVCNSL